jgi:hypothetical protein
MIVLIATSIKLTCCLCTWHFSAAPVTTTLTPTPQVELSAAQETGFEGVTWKHGQHYQVTIWVFFESKERFDLWRVWYLEGLIYIFQHWCDWFLAVLKPATTSEQEAWPGQREAGWLNLWAQIVGGLSSTVMPRQVWVLCAMHASSCVCRLQSSACRVGGPAGVLSRSLEV